MRSCTSLVLACLLAPGLWYPALAAPVTATLSYESACLDLDSGEIRQTCARGVDAETDWDVFIAYAADGAIKSVVFHNAPAGSSIAYLENADFSTVGAADADAATFSEDLVDRPFLTTDVILIRTDEQGRFKLGLPVEAETELNFQYERIP